MIRSFHLSSNATAFFVISSILWMTGWYGENGLQIMNYKYAGGTFVDGFQTLRLSTAGVNVRIKNKMPFRVFHGSACTPSITLPLESAAVSDIDTPSISTGEPNMAGTATNNETYMSRGDKRPFSFNQEALEEMKTFPRTYVPIASTTELDPNRPTPIEVLGQRYVVFQDMVSKSWTVMDDVCPHRLAPLSEGRLDYDESSGKTEIQCSYHGWKFNSTTGRCTTIPQATVEVEKSAIKSPRSCVPVYPTIVDKNIIWIWPWKQDVIEATMNAAAACEGRGGWGITPHDLTFGSPLQPTSTYTRELPYSYETLVENLLDPSHVPFAHHGMQGKRSDAIPIDMVVTTNITQSGFAYNWTDRTMSMMRRGEGRFRGPYTVVYDAKFYEQNPERDFNLAVLCVPVRPSWSRAIIFGPSSSPNPTTEMDDSRHEEGKEPTTHQRSKLSSSFRSKALKFVFSRIPVWVVHQLSNRFLDSDLAFLYFQERELIRRKQWRRIQQGPNSTRSNSVAEYYLPAASDRCVSALRSWFDKYVDLTPMSSNGESTFASPPMDQSKLFDRWTQHTSKCKHCLDGLKTLAKARKILFATSILCALFGFNLAVGKLMLVTSLALQPVISSIEKGFMEGGFKHYENH